MKLMKKKMFFYVKIESTMIIKMKMLKVDSHNCECKASHVQLILNG